MNTRLAQLAAVTCGGLIVVSLAMVRPTAAQQAPDAARARSPVISVPGDAPSDGESAGTSENLALAEMGIEQLTQVSVVAPALEMQVTTVTRQESTVGRSAAAVFVITQKMIRRSGARHIPDILRMVPGVNVAQIDSNKWAVSIRGFNDRFANKLQVQIDGRSVYTPLFGGVFWDVQDLILEDIDRIEVIRGPGATVWGTNAVNGVINIITKRAQDTQGDLLVGGAGNVERGFTSVRSGGQISDDAYYRVYGKWFERAEGFAPNDFNHDDWRQGRGGFRVDWDVDCCNEFTFQGDYYDGNSGSRQVIPDFFTPPFQQIVDDDQHVSGGNVLMRWVHREDEDRDWALQFYYDRTERHSSLIGLNRNIIDIDFQHRFPVGMNHNLIWGGGYRFSEDFIESIPTFVGFDPASRSLDWFSYFLQDEVTLIDDLFYFTIGSKFEHNDFTQFEFQPSARVLWTPDARHSGWASISRAVRIPTRADDNLVDPLLPISAPNPLNPAGPPLFPVFPVLTGSTASKSEDLLAYEVGFRAQPQDFFSWDATLFYYDYDDLSNFAIGPPSFGPPITFPLVFTNALDGETYGAELAMHLDLTEDWRLYGAYTYLDMQLHADPLPDGESQEGASPQNQVYFVSTWDMGHDWELDWITRYVDSLPALGVPHYITMDLRLGWRPSRDLELAIVGRNLLDAEHLEFSGDAATGTPSTEVRRGFYGILTRRY